MIDRELMQQALDALESCYDVLAYPANGNTPQDKAIEALRARLAQLEQKPINYEEWNYDPMTGKPLWGKQPEQEPVAWMHTQGYVSEASDRELFDDEIERGWTQIPLYTAPPQREWQGLTDEERYLNEARSAEEIEYARAIEAKLREKNA